MKRRQFLLNSGLLAAAPFAAAQQQGGGRGGAPPVTPANGPPGRGRGGRGATAAESHGLQPLNGGKIGNTPAMKITDIKTFLVGAGGRNWVYVKVLTDQGIYGIGEAYSAGPDEATVKVIEDFKSWLVGQRSSQRAISLRPDVQHHAFSRRHYRQLRHERHRARACGTSPEIRGRARMGAARRPRAEQGPRLPEHRRRHAAAGRRERQADDREVRLYGFENGDPGAGRYAVQPGHAATPRRTSRGARGGRPRCRYRRRRARQVL